MSKLTLSLYLIGCGYIVYWLYYILGQDMVLYSMRIIPGIVFLVLVFIFSPQINWLWWKKYTPDLTNNQKNWLNEHSPFYTGLNASDKAKYEKRVFLFEKSVVLEAKGLESAPQDFLSAISSQQIMITMGLSNFLTEPFERFIVYRTHFHSPENMERHASEINFEDNVTILAGNQLLFSVKKPTEYFNIGIYELARILKKNQPQILFPSIAKDDIQNLNTVASYTIEQAENQCNQKLEDYTALAIHHFFTFNSEMNEMYPEMYRRIKISLGL